MVRPFWGSAHGLRKAGAARLAELGASDREIMAITGHQTAREVDGYTRGARQKKLAASAMQKWEQDEYE
jgi:integrase